MTRELVGLTAVIPWDDRTTDPARHAALSYVLGWWSSIGVKVIVATGRAMCADGEVRWSKGASVIEGARQAETTYVAMADADVIYRDEAPIRHALAALRVGAHWVVPHQHVARLSKLGSEAVTRDALQPHHADRGYTHRGMAGGGVVILRRTDLLRVPPDPRFIGWGNEDEAWAMALVTLLGRCTRGSADLYHLWHPRAPRISPWVGNEAGAALVARYRAAKNRPGLMRALLAEIGER